MPYITEIRNETEFVTALQNFFNACNANKVALGLQAADLTEIQNASTNALTQLNAYVAARTAASAAHTTKNSQLKTSHAVISKWAKVFRSNATVPDSILAQLMLPPHSPGKTASQPSQPTSLVASADGLGNVALRWDRNGNIQGTQFLVEYRISNTSDFVVMGSTTKSKFTTVATPGSFIEFRVIAQRRGLASEPSIPVSLWNNSSASTPELKVA